MTTPSTLPKITARKKICRLLSLPRITLADIGHLSNHERRQLASTASKMLETLTGEERDRLLYKLELIMPADTKSSLWEHNHVKISSAIAKFMSAHGVMPTKNAIAGETGLSRQTVAKHLTEYRQHPEFTAEVEQFKFMSHNILAGVFKHASNGNIKAARLYLEMVGALNKQQPGTVVNAHNNYIQINNTILSQQNIQQLTAEQLDQIESIVNDKGCKVIG